MAEGGKENDKDNPFSFKKFVTKKDKAPADIKDSSVDDDIDIFSLADAGSRRKKEKSKQILVVDEEETSKQPKKKDKKERKENPFSFKKFLSGPVDGARPRSQENKRGPDVVNSDLPDFVQDHYTDTNLQASSRVLDLPDFTNVPASVPDITGFSNVQYSNNHSVQDSSRLSRNSLVNNAPIPLITHSNDADSDADGDFESLMDHHPVLTAGNSLPDFLSDTGIRGSVSPVDVNIPCLQSPVVEESVQIQQLKDSNTQLRAQLEELKQQKARDADCIASLRSELAEQKKKEIEETTTMERAMEQVEANLSSTTQRAIQAEATVAKLKQDVKSLQAEILTLRGGNGVTGDQFHSELKERTRYVAEQLTSATKTAESSLKQLLSGVDNLNLLSQVLMSIDKISEHKSSPDDKPADPT